MSSVGVMAFFGSAGLVALYSVFAVNITHKLRIDYFRKCLQKDAAYYDEHNTNEMATNIAKQYSTIQKGTGDKFGQIIYSVIRFIFGMLVAFYWGWLMSLILLFGLPFLIGIGGALAKMQAQGVEERMKAYSKSGGYAE